MLPSRPWERVVRRIGGATVLLGIVLFASCGKSIVVAGDVSNGSTGDAGPPDATVLHEAGQITCGSAVCGPVDVGAGMGIAGPCCYNSKCGVVFSNVCVELDSAGVADSKCPMAGTYPGCCRPDDTCGIDATGTRFGCVNPFVFFPTMVLGQCVYPR